MPRRPKMSEELIHVLLNAECLKADKIPESWWMLTRMGYVRPTTSTEDPVWRPKLTPMGQERAALLRNGGAR